MSADFARADQSVRYVKGVGPKLGLLLECKGLHTVEDLLYFLPRRYEDRRRIQTVAGAVPGSRETIVATSRGASVRVYGRRRVFEAVLADATGTLRAKWFRGSEAYLRRHFAPGNRLILTGEVGAFGAGKDMVHPDFEVLDAEDEGDLLHFRRIVPVYSETEGLPQKRLRRILHEALARFGDVLESPIPGEICARLGLPDMAEALQHVHFPPADADIARYNAWVSPGHRRLVFDEFFFFQLGLALKRHGRILEQGRAFVSDGPLAHRFLQSLPFALTAAQKRVMAEIRADMARSAAMHRLLQGDVGSGKTLVAFGAMATACDNGAQAALMAPTEILAEQHFANLSALAGRLGLAPVLLTGGIDNAARQEALEAIAAGRAPIVVGTHALLQEPVSFRDLGLVVIDEQHRFGVLQRAGLRAKGGNPDVLVMTATPIPRTLAMTVYGDLDVSVLDEMPPGRGPIPTAVLTEAQRPRAYDILRKELAAGRRVFVVYPLVSESEVLDLKDATRMAEHLQADVFPEFRVGLVHGRLKSKEKTAVMGDFASGRIQILVATTVVEVGIDIPEASVMVVEHAERFGLSQLHQLRGRVGRGASPARCLLLVGRAGSLDARKRLKTMAETGDGFRIAEADLEIRGPGEFMGVRQSGLPDFRVASILRDARLLDAAKQEAFALVERDPRLEKAEHAPLKAVLLRRWASRLALARTA